MTKCIVCDRAGEERKYFFKNKPLCSIDYSGYLEILLESMENSVTPEGIMGAFQKYQLCRPPTEKEIEQKKQIELDKKKKLERIEKEKNIPAVEENPFQMRR